VYAIGSLLLIIALSLVVTRVATVILVATGMSRDVARFQARSAFTGSGFTTHEAEQVVAHPLRRRTVMALMLLGSAGIVASVGSLMIGFTRTGAGANWVKLVELGAGLVLLVWISRSPAVDRRLTALIAAALRRFTDVPARDRAELVALAGDFAVTELTIESSDWAARRTLRELALRDEGIAVLGLTRDGTYIGMPTGSTRIEPGDSLVLYGREAAVADLDRRPAGTVGDVQHREAVVRNDARSSRLPN
jgi:TrkA-C domain